MWSSRSNGSSREHAVWALQDYGFEAVIAPRFGDIFRNNALKGGLIPVVLPEPVVRRILDAIEDDPTLEIVVDVVDRRVAVPAGRVAYVEIDVDGNGKRVGFGPG